MKTFVLITLLALSCLVRAEEMEGVFDPPPDWSDAQKKYWNETYCHWRLALEPDIAVSIDKPITTEQDCYVAIQLAFTLAQQQPNHSKLALRRLHSPIIVIFDNHSTIKETCSLIPRKNPYDSFPADAIDQAKAAGDQAMSDLIHQLDENLHLQCAMM